MSPDQIFRTIGVTVNPLEESRLNQLVILIRAGLDRATRQIYQFYHFQFFVFFEAVSPNWKTMNDYLIKVIDFYRF